MTPKEQLDYCVFNYSPLTTMMNSHRKNLALRFLCIDPPTPKGEEIFALQLTVYQ